RAGLVEGVQDCVFTAVGHARQQWEVELPADHGRQVEDLVRLLRQAIQAPADRLLDPLGNAEAGDVALVGPAVALLEDRARLTQMAENLADEERAALGFSMQRAGE